MNWFEVTSEARRPGPCFRGALAAARFRKGRRTRARLQRYDDGDREELNQKHLEEILLEASEAESDAAPELAGAEALALVGDKVGRPRQSAAVTFAPSPTSPRPASRPRAPPAPRLRRRPESTSSAATLVPGKYVGTSEALAMLGLILNGEAVFGYVIQYDP